MSRRARPAHPEFGWRPAPPTKLLKRATLGGLAKRWGISHTRAVQLAQEPTFPPSEPVLGGKPVYLIEAADAWRERHLERNVDRVRAEAERRKHFAEQTGRRA